MNRRHPYLSVTLLTLFLVPIVYIVQLVVLAIALNLPGRYAIGAMLVAAVIIEEIAKSVGITALIQKRDIRSAKAIVLLSFLAGLGFLLGEKLLLYVSVSIVSESFLSAALFNARMLWIPLLAHFSFTTIVCLLTRYWGTRRYLYALAAGVIVHVVYNLYVMGVIR
jgi:hypothetical protein